MTCRTWLAFGVLALAFASGCGGGGNAQGAQSAQASVSSMDQLKKIDEDVTAQVKELQKPLDEANKAVEDFSKLSEKYAAAIKPEQLSAMATASFDGKEITFEANTKLDDAAKADINETIGRLKAVSDQLKAIPDKSTAFGKQLGDYSAQVPTLAGKVQAESNVDLSNPLAAADVKARAQANIDGVGALQTQIQTDITDAQAKMTALPAAATEAQAKFAAALAPPAKTTKVAAAGKGAKKGH